jgi:hypothetical protein
MAQGLQRGTDSGRVVPYKVPPCPGVLYHFTSTSLPRWHVDGRQPCNVLIQNPAVKAFSTIKCMLQAPSEDLRKALGPTVTVFLSDVETDPWPAGNISALAAQSAR